MSDPTEAAPSPAPSPRFVAAAARSEAVPLEWPVEYDGRIWAEVTVRRPTTAEVAAWSRRVLAAREKGEPTDDIPAPVFDAPEVLLAVLDPDDTDRLEEVARRFLPRRFQVAPTA